MWVPFLLLEASGLGLCSCILAQCGIAVTATDRDEMALNNMRLIAEANHLNDRLSVAAFDWSDPSSFARLAGNKFNVDIRSFAPLLVRFGEEMDSLVCG